MEEEGSHLGRETQPEQNQPEPDPACTFPRGSGSWAAGGRVLLQEAADFLGCPWACVLLSGARLRFLRGGIGSRFAPWVWGEARQAVSRPDKLQQQGENLSCIVVRFQVSDGLEQRQSSLVCSFSISHHSG